jgi:hypothetical protein
VIKFNLLGLRVLFFKLWPPIEETSVGLTTDFSYTFFTIFEHYYAYSFNVIQPNVWNSSSLLPHLTFPKQVPKPLFVYLKLFFSGALWHESISHFFLLLSLCLQASVCLDMNRTILLVLIVLLAKVLCIYLQDQTHVVFVTRFIFYNSYYHYKSYNISLSSIYYYGNFMKLQWTDT